MKRLFTLLSCLATAYCYGQINCDATPIGICNFIQNPAFQSTSPYGTTISNAFVSNGVANWYDSYGTCDLNLWSAQPSPIPNTNYAAMGIESHFNGSAYAA